jgi:hypothetical protein
LTIYGSGFVLIVGGFQTETRHFFYDKPSISFLVSGFTVPPVTAHKKTGLPKVNRQAQDSLGK